MYSTIRVKKGICPKCGPGSGPKPLTAGLCNPHYWESRRVLSAERANAKDRGELEPVKILLADLDLLFSQQVRLTYADEYGMVKCYTCDTILNWKHMQNGHYIPRAQMPTRYDLRNCRPECEDCNKYKDGNLIVFAERLETEEPGIVAMLQELSREVQDYSREELKYMIGDTTRKVKNLMKKIIYQ